MTIDDMKRRKTELGYSYQHIADLSGLPIGTVQRVLSGQTRSPRYNTVQKLAKVLGKGQSNYHYPALDSDSGKLYVKEETAAFFRFTSPPGIHTVDEYFALPDDKRVELIDGEFYDMDSPRVQHNLAVMQICAKILAYIDQNKGPCKVIPGPTDVQLDEDDYTMVVPDAIVVCDPSKYKKGYTVGAPDFCLEVVSPSSQENDYMRKYLKYYCAGVREYWIVDPQKRIVTVYDFEHDGPAPSIYSFDQKVPVAIYDGELAIDFKEVADYMA